MPRISPMLSRLSPGKRDLRRQRRIPAIPRFCPRWLPVARRVRRLGLFPCWSPALLQLPPLRPRRLSRPVGHTSSKPEAASRTAPAIAISTAAPPGTTAPISPAAVTVSIPLLTDRLISSVACSVPPGITSIAAESPFHPSMNVSPSPSNNSADTDSAAPRSVSAGSLTCPT